MDNRPIGVFDSGLGGLTAVKELRRALPGESILYFGDTGRVPYGTKSPETIQKYTKQDMNFLLQKGVKIIVAACGTVSSTAKETLMTLPVPHVTVIEPTAKAALQATKNGRVGVIATPATIRSGAFQQVLQEHCQVLGQACPLLVPLVENGFVSREDPVTKLVLERYLKPFMEACVDTLILGCTHFPIIAEAISDVMGKGVTLINSGRETARHCGKILAEAGLLADKPQSQNHYYVSDSIEGFHDIAEIFLGTDLGGQVSRIDIEKY